MAQKFICHPGFAEVKTNKGMVRGYFANEVYAFKGIPYAKAKRFHAPEEADAWDNVFEALNYGFVCPLIDPNEKPNGELAVPHRYWPMNEDCMNLNVWTPELDDKKRPVIFWMHGGGFEAGSSIEQIAYEGYNMAKIGDVVVVSINHRLNVLGFYDFSDFGEEYKSSAVNGMKDIVMALKWVKANIANFGGDPENIVLMGQSGGGAKVTTLLQMPEADGLYAKGVNMSGVIGPVLADQKGSGKEMAEAMMKELGISSMKEMEEVSIHDLMAAYSKVRPEFKAAGKYNGGTPKKNEFYFGDPSEHGFREETKNVPLMVGSTFGEFFGFMPSGFDKSKATNEEGAAAALAFAGDEIGEKLISLFKEAYPERNPGDLLNYDTLFRAPEIVYNKKRAALNDCTYVYLFNHDLQIDGGKCPWHCADIPYFFHNTELVPVTWEEGVTEKLEAQIFDSLIAFAKTGNPNHAGIPNWKASSEDEEHVMLFGTTPEVKCNFDHELNQLAATLIPKMFGRFAGTDIQH